MKCLIHMGRYFIGKRVFIVFTGYANLSADFNFCPASNIKSSPQDEALIALNMVTVLSKLILRPKSLQEGERLFARFYNSCSVWASKAQSLAYK